MLTKEGFPARTASPLNAQIAEDMRRENNLKFVLLVILSQFDEDHKFKAFQHLPKQKMQHPQRRRKTHSSCTQQQ
jgi:hypothetical protein